MIHLNKFNWIMHSHKDCDVFKDEFVNKMG